MSDLRRPVITDTVREGDTVRLYLAIPPELFWFQGHFPGFPILPGVVQLDWALAFAREFLGLAIESGQSFQVKFNQPIVPGDTIELALAHDQTRGRVRFSYMRGGETCSSGQVKVP